MTDLPAEGRAEYETAAPGTTPRGEFTLPRPGSRTGEDRTLIEGAIVPTLVMFALPLLTTNILHSLSGTWTAVWVSRSLGENALIAVVNANIFLFMMMGAVTGVGTAAGITIGQAHGSGDRHAVKRVVGTALTFVMSVSTLIAIGGWLLAPTLLDWIDMPGPARNDARIFLRVTCLAMPSIFTFIFMMMMMRGRGDAKTPFKFSVLWIALSFCLVPLLITGAFGFPKLGIAGAALANLIGNTLALAALVAFVYAKDMPIALRRGEFHHFRPDFGLLWMLIRRGAPMGAEMILVQGAYFVLLAMVNGYGVTTAAAYSAAAQLWGYVQMPAIAFAASISAMAAQNIGAGLWPRISQIALRGSLLSMATTASAAALLYLLGDWPLLLFLPEGGEALEIAHDINAIVLWSWTVLAITTAIFGIVRANAAMVPPTVIFFITMWLLRVPFAEGLQPWLAEKAIWWSFPVGTISSALLAWAYYRYGGWRENRLMLER